MLTIHHNNTPTHPPKNKTLILKSQEARQGEHNTRKRDRNKVFSTTIKSGLIKDQTVNISVILMSSWLYMCIRCACSLPMKILGVTDTDCSEVEGGKATSYKVKNQSCSIWSALCYYSFGQPILIYRYRSKWLRNALVENNFFSFIILALKSNGKKTLT